MNITYSNYIELPAPLDTARAALRDRATWDMLPLPARRQGDMWLHNDELYSLTFEETPPDSGGISPAAVLRWNTTPVAVPGLRLQVEVQLYDGVISTHALVRASLLNRGLAPFWQRALLRNRLSAAVEQACTTLKARLYEYQPAPVTIAEPQLVAADGTTMPATETTAGSPGGNGRGPATLADRLRARYPLTVAHFEEIDAGDHLERVWRLERGWEQILAGHYDKSFHQRTPAAPERAALNYDLIYAGGGLGLLHAAVMAQLYGRRVLLFDRSEVGCVHREWNISRAELQTLVDMGFATWDELGSVIMRDYHAGLVKFYNGPASGVPESELWFPDVLNVAIDAGGLLRLMRHKFEQAGGTILDRRNFRCVRVPEGPISQVEVVLESLDTGAQEVYTARLLLDGMGSTSPLALLRHAGKPFAGVCPTVGTVVSGLVPGSERNQFDPTIGDILISVDDAQDNKQMIWEGFPGRGDELTVYMFYYAALKNFGRSFETPPRPAAAPAPLDDPQPRYSLLALFEQYFALLPSYKQPGPHFRHVKPVYGYIPGRHSVRPQDAPLLPGVLPVGDSAAQQSPLTYCGFGSHVRNLHRTTSLLEYALRHNLLEPQHMQHITAFQTNVSLNWVFSRFMQPWGTPHGVNEIQNAFLSALNYLGPDVATRFFRDRMRWRDYNQVVWQSMLRYPVVFKLAFLILGVRGVWQWFNDYLRFSVMWVYAAGGRALGPRGEQALYWLAGRLSPGAALRMRARYAEWRVMGWITH